MIKMKKFSRLALLVAAVGVTVVLIISEVPPAEAVNCTPSELSSCLSAITVGTPPSSMCCSKLKEQTPCLCGYLKDPNLQGYVNSPNARKVASFCGVSYPNCS